MIPASRTGAPAPATEALCNDDSPFGFYVHVASPTEKRWMIALEGGGACAALDSDCLTRSTKHPDLVTGIYNEKKAIWAKDGQTAGYSPSKDGIAASTDATFGGFNKAFANYCSSDLWSGESSAPKAFPGFPGFSAAPKGAIRFRGATNVLAMLELLLQRYGLMDDGATRVLFVGGSAGAFGVHANAARVANLLPTVAGAGHLRVLSDGGLSPIDWPIEKGSSATITQVFTNARASLWEGGPLHPVCENDSANIGAEGRCYLGATALHAIAAGGGGVPPLPVMAVANELDSVLLGLQSKDKPKILLSRLGDWRQQQQTLLTTTTGAWPLWASTRLFVPCGATNAQLANKETVHTWIWKSETDTNVSKPTVNAKTAVQRVADVWSEWEANAPIDNTPWVQAPCP
ncbi:MAG: pectin acetylesterase-family hydrolase [Pseudomonadota bacterium]|nr:pectin acetylesterase-family hydrolase [Pseudomonadota bacterium]